MPWNDELNNLRQALAYLYPTEADSRVIVASAGLESGHIAFNSKAVLNWQSILEEALKQDKVPAIVAVAVRQYPENEVLAKAVSSGQAWIDQGELEVGGVELIRIPAGPFLMGSVAAKEIPEHEQPLHSVDLPAYAIGKYPVTNAQYEEFVRKEARIVAPEMGWDGQSPPDQRRDFPIAGVTWYDALAYCHWLGRPTGFSCTLPSEAQWEKAARGTDGRLYPFGDGLEDGRSNAGGQDLASVHAFPPQSVYGCCDMVGNVREWTRTLWGERLGEPDARYRYPWKVDDRDRNDEKANDQIRRVWRGCAYSDPPNRLRCAARGAELPDRRGPPKKRFGFRVVVLTERKE